MKRILTGLNLTEKDNFNVELVNKSAELAMIAIQGPHSLELLQDMGLLMSDQPARFAIKGAKLGNIDALVSKNRLYGRRWF
ncbi:MAG: hypothetical protein MZU84_03570 [Sphingobacterium sp.]|nr:hypothetical protein [Sphingobacterium sp.]